MAGMINFRSAMMLRLFHREGHPGLIAPSARCDGLNALILNEKVLSDPRDYCYLLYRYGPIRRQFEVERAVGKVMLTILNN